MTDAPAAGPPCPVCGAPAEAAPRFVVNGHAIHRCPACTAGFVHPLPAPEAAAALYDADYFRRGDKYAAAGPDPNRANDEAKLDLLLRFGAPQRLLDVGCALGGFLLAARDRGLSVTGVEVAEAAVRHAREVAGLEVIRGDLAGAGLPAGAFDAVTLWDVLEHLADPYPTLREAHRILKPGGLLALTTGDAASPWARLTGRFWHLLTPPQHLYYHTPRSIGRLLAATGFTPVHTGHPGKRATLGFIAFKAAEATGPPGRLLRAVVRALGLGNVQLHVNLGDIVTVVARKADAPGEAG